ncbi:MAG: hypothetical protein Q7U86_09795 [Draconibacterium sp.]|nr:hypothetical protein [Draconibacterium sp.]
MKTILMLTILTLAFSVKGFSSSYEETMTANIQKMNVEFTTSGLTSLAGQFERIANAESGKWQPRYYAAYCYVWATAISEMPAGDKHKLLDLAQAQMDILLKSVKKESEIFVLQAFLYQMRITDMGKGMKYSGLASEALDEAEKLNPNNPRIYYVRGNNVYNTPKAFGGGKEKAKPLFAKASGLFETQKPANAIEPAWGSEHNNKMLAMCNSKDE